MKALDPVYDFALRIARALKESKSSTALFFMQQAYPNDVDSPAEQPGSDAILDNIIALASLTQQRTEAAVGGELDEELERMRTVRTFTDEVTKAFDGHPDRNKIVGVTVGLAVKSFMRPPAVDTGSTYWEDKALGLWANAPYFWCDRVVVLRDSRFVDDLTREEFGTKYPGMVRIPDDPREWYALQGRLTQPSPQRT